ncbi:MAG: hypothetical protein EBY29_07245 [Planctomycetes bacterium]|jgi:hypothetical protein|nr:hypothetical protein [Planctomycetota bacterium]
MARAVYAIGGLGLLVVTIDHLFITHFGNDCGEIYSAVYEVERSDAAAHSLNPIVNRSQAHEFVSGFRQCCKFRSSKTFLAALADTTDFPLDRNFTFIGRQAPFAQQGFYSGRPLMFTPLRPRPSFIKGTKFLNDAAAQALTREGVPELDSLTAVASARAENCLALERKTSIA